MSTTRVLRKIGNLSREYGCKFKHRSPFKVQLRTLKGRNDYLQHLAELKVIKTRSDADGASVLLETRNGGQVFLHSKVS